MNRMTIPALLTGALLSLGAAAQESPFDLSPDQPGREHVEPNPEAIAAIPADFPFVTPGKLTVGSNPAGGPPLTAYATDTRTVVGADADVALLIAESLGLELEIIPTAWADWPLALQSAKVDAVFSNVGVTEERKEKFDFATYRQGLHGFFVHEDSEIQSIAEPQDIAGLKVVVGIGTNQERILNKWNEINIEAGLPAAELIYYDDEGTKLLALRSKRVDVMVQPNAQLVFIAARDGDFRSVGTLSAGWPERSDVAAPFRKGSGLAEPVSIAINGLIEDGVYLRTLERWHVGEEALEQSQVNPPGLPKF
ncbi:ABC transporter substrate-binding protein [Celeribacter indicus]|uniref:Putative cystine-binding periplasmic protein n=1 Tax=Celeribacter indicus TaxID=1208324 RepID=A0A0B5E5Y2_9RHOB|nr:ABC transporter substrate-binding protein [Celeribacter indicus]AJE48805.1 putative cystine-binding periplasmic protein [Celeribacter indicus]SDW37862.1 amino acid ABC transporter substrate-binding protein, PAAT family [Celeribacter indicus]